MTRGGEGSPWFSRREITTVHESARLFIRVRRTLEFSLLLTLRRCDTANMMPTAHLTGKSRSRAIAVSFRSVSYLE